jgi:hypothetical protein
VIALTRQSNVASSIQLSFWPKPLHIKNQNNGDAGQ